LNIEKINEFAHEHGYETVEKLLPWNGYEVYEPIRHKDISSKIGPPLIILVKNDEIRFSTEEEAFQQLHDSIENDED